MLFGFVLYFFGQLKWTVLIYCVFYVRSKITRPNHTLLQNSVFVSIYIKFWVWNCFNIILNVICYLLIHEGVNQDLYQLCWTVVATGVIVDHFNLCVISFLGGTDALCLWKTTKFWFTYRTHHPMWINKENKTAQEEVRHFFNLKVIFKIRSQIFIVFRKKEEHSKMK